MKIHKKLVLLISLAAIASGLLLTAGSSALAFPSMAQDCSNCHGTSGTYPNTVSAVPSSTTVAPGASYTVDITMDAAKNGANGTGYWIANSNAAGATGTSTGVFAGGGGSTPSGSWTGASAATMTASSTPGTYYFKVFGQSGPSGGSGDPGFVVFSITVAAAPPANVAPAVTTQPADQTVLEGNAASFSAAASGTPAPTVQWQISADGGTTFGDIAGATAATYSFTTVASDNGSQFRAVFTNVAGSATSNAATLTATTPAPPVPPIAGSGQQLYMTYCSACHDRTAAGFVGETASGASAGKIREAIREEKPMSFLSSILSSQSIQDIATYLKSLAKDDKDGHEDKSKHEDKDRHEEKDKDNHEGKVNRSRGADRD